MRTIAAVAAGCLLATAFVSQALSADPAKPANYPNRPINFVVAYPVGGGMDITARTLASEMERVTGHQFRVENRGGGGGIIGNTHMAKQTQPDGYTVGILANPTLFMNILNQGASFKKEDFEPIAGAQRAKGLLVSAYHVRITSFCGECWQAAAPVSQASIRRRRRSSARAGRQP